MRTRIRVTRTYGRYVVAAMGSIAFGILSQ